MLIKASGKSLVAVARLDSATFALLCEMPGRKFWVGRALHFSPIAQNIAYLAEHFPGAEWDKSARSHLDQFIERQSAAQEALRKKTAPDLPDDGSYKFKTKPYDHQRRVFLLSRDAEDFALFMEQGTGKSKPLIDTAAYRFAIRGDIDAAVIVAPNNVHRNWLENEVPAHLPDWCPRSCLLLGAHMRKWEVEEFNELLLAKDKLPFFSFNVEAFQGGNGLAPQTLQKILLSRRTLLIIDESQRIKNPTAKRTKTLTKLRALAKARRIATGTPITQGLEDAFAQWRFLNPSIIGFDSFYTYRNHFCVMGGFEAKQIVGYKNVDEYIKLVSPHSFRVLKKDCLDLPQKIYKRVPFELTKLQRSVYDELRREFEASLRDNRMTVPLAITRLLRLQQIACNWFTPDEGKKPRAIDTKENARLKAMLSIIEDHSGKFLIWSRFVADIKLIIAALSERYGPKSVVGLWGETPAADRGKVVKRLQEDPACRFLVGQQQAGGVGVTLTAASNTIYYSNTFNLEDRLQSEDRNHRIGTKQNVIYFDLEAVKTIDRKIINALRNKKQIADIVNQDPANLFIEE